MNKITITEALAETKLIANKIAKKRQTVNETLTYYEHQPDPYISKGGVSKVMAGHVQAIRDLELRLIQIRNAIARANLDTRVKIGDNDISIFDWLNWKREIAKPQLQFVTEIYNGTKRQVDEDTERPRLFSKIEDEDKEKKEMAVLKTVFKYTEFLDEAERIQETLDELDGKLSLKNATVMIEI